MVAAIVVLSVVFALVTAVIVLRFTVVLRQLFDSMALDRRERAQEMDRAHSTAFGDAMSALESINQKVVDSHTAMLARTMDMVAGPQTSQTPDSSQYATDRPAMDPRPPWKPDDEFDYTGLGIDPTDDTLPDPPMEPEGNEHRAVMLPPGQGLLPPDNG